MADVKPPEQSEAKDRLITRPDEPLPAAEDPQGAKARGYPADPKPGEGNPTGSAAQEIGRTV